MYVIYMLCIIPIYHKCHDYNCYSTDSIKPFRCDRGESKVAKGSMILKPSIIRSKPYLGKCRLGELSF